MLLYNYSCIVNYIFDNCITQQFCRYSLLHANATGLNAVKVMHAGPETA